LTDECEDHYYQSAPQIFYGNSHYLSNFTLSHLEERLQHYGFFRCHRSYIENLQKVREVITWTRNSYSLVLDDQAKSSILLSKTKMAKLKWKGFTLYIKIRLSIMVFNKIYF